MEKNFAFGYTVLIKRLQKRGNAVYRTLDCDRSFIENKYHLQDAPFDPFKRRAYHGYDYPSETGLSDEEIMDGLRALDKKLDGLPHPIAKAEAIRYVLENTRIDVNDRDYFVGIYSWDRLPKEITVHKWKNEIFSETIPEIDARMKEMNASGAVTIWPDFDHVVPDWHSLLSLGFPGIRERARRYRLRHAENGTLTSSVAAYFDGIEIEYSASIALFERLAAFGEARNTERSRFVAASLRRLASGAPQNFFDALQLMYLYFMISESVDYYQVRSLGNGLDRSLFPFYERDLQNGTFTREEMREFLGYFFLQWSAIGNYWGQPFYLAGTDENGNTRVNALSHDIIDVYGALDIYNPKIQIKVSHNTPRGFLDKVFTLIRQGKNSFVFCCEPGMIKAVMGYGATYEEARDMDIRGCYETGGRANEVSTVTGYVNALKPVLYALSNGRDETIGRQFGLETGELASLSTFENFYTAITKQLLFLVDETVRVSRAYEQYLGVINPSSLYSATVETSLDKGLDAYQNGVKFNNSAILLCGLGSMVDAVMAVKEFVYVKKELSLEELKRALNANFVGYEKLRAKIRASKHKYGNGDAETDLYAAMLAHLFCSRVNGTKNSRGGIYKAILHSARQFIEQGKKTGATPDGRCAGEEISKNASPSIGMDRNGVTALIRSALALHPSSFHESFCLDVMLHSSAVSGENGNDILYALLDTYRKKDGMSIQFNVMNAEALRDAREHPEHYRNLQVRVCGWNVLWNNLSKEEQDAYILRSENIQV